MKRIITSTSWQEIVEEYGSPSLTRGEVKNTILKYLNTMEKYKLTRGAESVLDKTLNNMDLGILSLLMEACFSEGYDSF